jgi:hypothetical protein
MFGYCCEKVLHYVASYSKMKLVTVMHYIIQHCQWLATKLTVLLNSTAGTVIGKVAVRQYL